MKFSRTVELRCTVPDAFMRLHDPVVFRRVSRPFLVFTAVNPPEFPAHYVSGESYVVRAKAFGLFPLGTQEINPESSMTPTSCVFRDNGRGLSGSLGVVTSFRHTMTLEPQGPHRSILRDELEWDAGSLTPLFGLGFRIFWFWRHLVMRRLSASW